jgi:hypothetical protein
VRDLLEVTTYVDYCLVEMSLIITQRRLGEETRTFYTPQSACMAYIAIVHCDIRPWLDEKKRRSLKVLRSVSFALDYWATTDSNLHLSRLNGSAAAACALYYYAEEL